MKPSILIGVLLYQGLVSGHPVVGASDNVANGSVVEQSVQTPRQTVINAFDGIKRKITHIVNGVDLRPKGDAALDKLKNKLSLKKEELGIDSIFDKNIDSFPSRSFSSSDVATMMSSSIPSEGISSEGILSESIFSSTILSSTIKFENEYRPKPSSIIPMPVITVTAKPEISIIQITETVTHIVTQVASVTSIVSDEEPITLIPNPSIQTFYASIPTSSSPLSLSSTSSFWSSFSSPSSSSTTSSPSSTITTTLTVDPNLEQSMRERIAYLESKLLQTSSMTTEIVFVTLVPDPTPETAKPNPEPIPESKPEDSKPEDSRKVYEKHGVQDIANMKLPYKVSVSPQFQNHQAKEIRVHQYSKPKVHHFNNGLYTKSKVHRSTSLSSSSIVSTSSSTNLIPMTTMNSSPSTTLNVPSYATTESKWLEEFHEILKKSPNKDIGEFLMSLYEAMEEPEIMDEPETKGITQNDSETYYVQDDQISPNNTVESNHDNPFKLFDNKNDLEEAYRKQQFTKIEPKFETTETTDASKVLANSSTVGTNFSGPSDERSTLFKDIYAPKHKRKHHALFNFDLFRSGSTITEVSWTIMAVALVLVSY